MTDKNKTTMLSLDTSTTHSGVGVWENGKLIKCFSLDKPKTEGPGGSWMTLALIDTLNKYKPDIVIIEEESTSRNMKTTRELIMLIGVIKGWCLTNNVFFDVFPPKVWRQQICIENETCPNNRAQAKLWAAEKVKLLFNITASEDVCEAILIGQAYINYTHTSL